MQRCKKQKLEGATEKNDKDEDKASESEFDESKEDNDSGTKESTKIGSQQSQASFPEALEVFDTSAEDCETEDCEECESDGECSHSKTWQPPRLARFVKNIQMIGRGRLEIVEYRIIVATAVDDDAYEGGTEKRDGMRLTDTITKILDLRIQDIERIAGELEAMKWFDETENGYEGCLLNSSSLNSCKDLLPKDEITECFECGINERIRDWNNEIGQKTSLFKENENQSTLDDKLVNWKKVGDDIEEIFDRITKESQTKKKVNWLGLSKLVRSFLLFLTSAEISEAVFDDRCNWSYSETSMVYFSDGFEKGTIYQTIQSAKKIMRLYRKEADALKVSNSVKIRGRKMDKTDWGKEEPNLGDSNASIIKAGDNTFSLRMDKIWNREQGVMTAIEIRTARSILLDPLLTIWSNQIQPEEPRDEIEKLRKLGMVVTKELDLTNIGPGKNIEGSMMWERNEGKMLENAIKYGEYTRMNIFRPEPKQPMDPKLKRKLNMICLN